MLDDKPKLKKFLLYLLNHPYSARPRWWTRAFIIPFIIKRGKGSIIRRSARLDIIPSKRFSIGERSIIETNVVINNGMGDVIIGDRSIITSKVTIVGPVTIGNNVILANSAQVIGLTHNWEDVNIPIIDQGVSVKTTVIEDDVWIGGNCVVIQGITIGTHSVVGSGSVVTKDIPPYSLAVGNPARVIKRYDFDLKQWVKV